jgi:DNA-binding CsgD family transcriptional regulator
VGCRRRGALAEPLTDAEQRVLMLLPTSTYLQIADILYISRNTVKTHLWSIYRKLGAISRSRPSNGQLTCASSELPHAPAERRRYRNHPRMGDDCTGPLEQHLRTASGSENRLGQERPSRVQHDPAHRPRRPRQVDQITERGA